MSFVSRASGRISIAVLAAGISFGAAADPITPERLLNAAQEPHNWLMWSGTYNGWGYSALSQINRSNVANLRPVFQASIGGMSTGTYPGAYEDTHAKPLVEDGFMYLTDSQGKLMKFDVRSGYRAVPLWRFDPGADAWPYSKGIGLFRDTIIHAAYNSLVAVGKESGELVWDTNIVEAPIPEINLEAPPNRSLRGVPTTLLTAGGQEIVGAGAYGSGVGWFGAWEANTGELLWRTHTIPLPGDPNFGTWPGETWRHGRAMPWSTFVFDPESNQIVVGIGEPTPSGDPEFRPGDNLYSNSTLVLDADTGAIQWYFQTTPNDGWDFDSVAVRMLIPVPDGAGGMQPAVHHFDRNGFFYSNNLETGEFIRGFPHVREDINWTAGLDPKTGKPVSYDPNQSFQAYLGHNPVRGRSLENTQPTCTTNGGGPSFWPPSYNPDTGIAFQTGTSGCSYYLVNRPTPEIGAEGFNPVGGENIGSSISRIQTDSAGVLVAVDVQNGEVVQRYTRHMGISAARQAQNGALATAGGLVFTGWHDGTIAAYDQDTLAELWSYNVGTSVEGGMITYSVNGKQYIAQLAGGENEAAGELIMLPTAILIVFALE